MMSSNSARLYPSLSELDTSKDTVGSNRMAAYNHLRGSGDRANDQEGLDEVDMALVRPPNTPRESPALIKRESGIPLLARRPRSPPGADQSNTAGSRKLASMSPEEAERRRTLNRTAGLAVVRPTDSPHSNITDPFETSPDVSREAEPNSQFYVDETSTDDIDATASQFDDTSDYKPANETSEIQRGCVIGFEGLETNGHSSVGHSSVEPTKNPKTVYNADGTKITNGRNRNNSQSNSVDKPDLGITREVLSSKGEKAEETREEEGVSFIKLGLCIFSIVTYVVDVGTDVWAAYTYHKRGDFWWFTWTLVFILVPSITMTLFSMLWYIQDRNKNKVSPLLWVSRFTCLLLQVGLLYRYVCILVFGCLVRRRHHDKRRWMGQLKSEDSDAALLRLIESFMEAAPQLCLQLYIMTHRGPDSGTFLLVIQILSCVTSLLSLAWALAGYHRTLRLALTNKHDITYVGSALQFCWRLCTVGTRVLAIAMFTSHFKGWVGLLLIHWALMVIWLNLFLGSQFCKTEEKTRAPLEYLFRLVIAAVYVFDFLNPAEGHTRLRYMCYYALVYLENVAMVAAWYLATKSQSRDLWYGKPVIIVVTCLFFVGIFFMALYYYKFHPNNSHEREEDHIKLWLTWDDYKDELKPSLDCSKQIDKNYV